jgi:transposase-like protein
VAATQKTEARWRALVREQESRGETVQDFARRRGLSAASLYWWRSQLRRSGRERSAGVALAPVTLLRSEKSVHSGGGGFEIVLRNGRRVIVPADYDAESLRHLVVELERGC